MSRPDEGEITWEVLNGDEWVELEVTYEIHPGTPPSGLSGPPENYDPGSGEEVNITKATLNGEPYTLSDDDEEKLINKIIETHVFEPDDPPEDDDGYWEE
jgi:hypothetical protein